MVAVSAKAESSRVLSCCLQQLANAPHMIGDPSLHRRRDAQGFVHAPKVVPAIPKHHSRAMIAEIFREAKRQTRKPLHGESQRQIGTLHMRSTNEIGVRSTADWDYLGAHHFGGRVPALAFGSGAVDLDELGKIYPMVQSVQYCGAVRSKAICGQLEVPSRSLGQTFDEDIGSVLIARSNRDVKHQLRDWIECNVCPRITPRRIVLRALLFLLAAHKLPYLVGLYFSRTNVNDSRRHNALAFLSCKNEQLQDRLLMYFREPYDAGDTVALKQELENHLGFLDGQVHAVKRGVAGIREHLAALRALIALTRTAFTELPAIGTTGMACHSGLELSSGRVHNGIGPTIHSLGFGLRLNPVGSFNYLRGLVFCQATQVGRKSSNLPKNYFAALYGAISLCSIFADNFCRLALRHEPLQNVVYLGEEIGSPLRVKTSLNHQVSDGRRSCGIRKISAHQLADTIRQAGVAIQGQCIEFAKCRQRFLRATIDRLQDFYSLSNSIDPLFNSSLCLKKLGQFYPGGFEWVLHVSL
jgi:hypothetical protein